MVFSSGFFRDQEYRKLGVASPEDILRFFEGFFRQKDAGDLLTLLWTWQHADIGANDVYNEDLIAALGAIRSRAIVMPCDMDLLFSVCDSVCEAEHMPTAEVRTIRSIWGHVAGYGANRSDNKIIDGARSDLLAG